MAHLAFRYELFSKSSRRTFNQALFLLLMLMIGLLYTLFGPASSSHFIPTQITQQQHLSVFQFENNHNQNALQIFIPSLTQLGHEHQHRTLFIFPGTETRCYWQFNYICKFWFYIRCFVLGAFPNVQTLPEGIQALDQLKQRAKQGDIALVVWRSRKHRQIPNNLRELLEWQQLSSQPNNNVPRLRIGVLHIANEVNRTDWHWYLQPDFIIRNYWIPDMPAHATYIPLGPQFPNQCMPWSTDDDKWTHSAAPPPCSCNSVSLPKASSRKYLWHFSGSLRKRRSRLVKLLRSSKALKSRGYIQVSKHFGGQGVFGSKQDDNPKTQYLQSILQSKFVFAPCGNAMETHRIYEAIALGAIPVIENCDPAVSHFFPFTELLIDGDIQNMVEFVQRYLHKEHEIDALQQRVQHWWRQYSINYAKNVSRIVTQHVPPALRTAP
ncbi:unnamed protein product [Agarophyton chilense]